METRANYAMIGLFTLLIVFGAFAFAYWIGGRDAGTRRNSIAVIFTGSVSGLLRGGSVNFNGVRVGEVTDIRLMPNDPRRVVVRIEVDESTPVKADTRARLESQGLTGVASIALVGGDPESGPLTAPPGQPLPTIYGDPSDLQDLFQTVRDVAGKVDTVLAAVQKVVQDSEGSITRTVQNVERFSQALSDNSEGVGDFLKNVGAVAQRIGPLADRLETVATDLSSILKAVEPERIGRVVGNLDSFTQALGDNRGQVDTILKDAASLARQLNESAGKLDTTLESVSAVARALDPEKVGRLVDNADRFAQALGATSGDVEKAVREAAQITEKLNRSADRIDGVLIAAQSFLGSAAGEEGKATFADVGEAARSIRVLADNLDKRTAEITAGINRFTGPGLRDIESVAGDARRTLGDLSRAVQSLERNPQQFLFGGRAPLPEYNGRR